jgi:GDPmannose 4,6-dehydratase
MTRILEAEKPDDYVLATGRTVAVRDFVNKAARAAGFDIEWRGEGVDEHGIERNSRETVVRVSEKFYRPAEVDQLLGSAEKAKRDLGWEARVSLEEMTEEMVGADLRRHGVTA